MRIRTINLVNATPTVSIGTDGNPTIASTASNNYQFVFQLNKAIEVETGARIKLVSFSHTGTGVTYVCLRLTNLSYNLNLNIINLTAPTGADRAPIIFSGDLSKTNDYSVIHGNQYIILNKQVITSITLFASNSIENASAGIPNNIRFIVTLQIEED